MKKNSGFPWPYIILILLFLLAISSFSPLARGPKPEPYTYGELVEDLRDKKVESLKITKNSEQSNAGTAEVVLKGEEGDTAKKEPKTVRVVSIDGLTEIATAAKMEDSSLKLDTVISSGTAWISTYIVPLIFLVATIGILIFFMQRMQDGGGSKAMNFGRSRAKLSVDDGKKVLFAHVAGLDEEKNELQELVEFLKAPKKFIDIGARIPKGVLLVGPPGTGKTLLAKAVAGEAGVPFFSISGSDFVEMFVGVGASRVRDLFEQAKKNLPCIIFIDEIDAVGRKRGAGLGGGHDEREQTLNQLLVEMDGFAINEGIIIIAATNRPDILDSALLRPGRFDRQVAVGLPDVKGREQILEVHSKGKQLAADVDFKTIAQTTAGFTGADLENLLNEAALLAAREDKTAVDMEIIGKAFIKVGMGTEKKSRVITEKEKYNTAIHEGGHAIIAEALPDLDPVHIISIIPVGRALGFTMPLPSEDRLSLSKSYMEQELVMYLGGRAAEEIMFSEFTTGASNDIERASSLARRMVTRFGMSSALGPVQFGDEQNEVFIGRDWGHTRNYGEEVASIIDRETLRLLNDAYKKAVEIINRHRDVLENTARLLLKREKITGEEFRKLFRGEEVDMNAPQILPGFGTVI